MIEFQPIMSISVIFTFYRQTKTSNGFWYRQILNSKLLIQPLETLLDFLFILLLYWFLLIILEG